MVRTPSPVVPLHLDASRVLGWSTAIAVHALALMLLLIPATQPLIKAPRERLQVRWVLPPPPPMDLTPRHPDPVPPRTVPVNTQRVPSPLPPPTATFDDAPAVAPLPASETAAPSLASAPAAPAPAAGAQLQYRSAPPPPYPVAAIRLGQQGTVLLRIRVDTEGNPLSVSIEKSSGSRVLDQAARQQVLRRWRFVPAIVDGQTVAADGLVPIDFTLPR
ncbi:TonB family protein [Stenotrophomonas sp. TWI819]|uniref:energy transducer TonB n=1 Tax=Stenotrophomonas sp. TWI819 TaxID=3136800 RepID=UPI003209BFA2